MKKNYVNAEIVICGFSSEDVISTSSGLSGLTGKITVNESTPGIGGDSINIGFDGLGE